MGTAGVTFPKSFLEEIRARVPVSQVVGRRLPLKKQGREFVALSPFQKEKTPSFFVNDDKAFYHCFSSGKHGDVFDFLMEVEGLSFPEAVAELARQAGMDLPAPDPRSAQQDQQRRSIIDALEVACRYYQTALDAPEGRAARAYLDRRGVDRTAIERFRLGYAPAGDGGLIGALKTAGLPEALWLESTLLRRPDDGRPAYPFLRDRLVFPVLDRRERVIAFGGRRLLDDAAKGPKYLNSPEHPGFHKGQALYGWPSARAAAAKGAPILVVEGYMDVIALSQAGWDGAVAPLGTALSEAQCEEIWRLAGHDGPTPILCFDGDRAGRAAAIKAMQRALPLLQPGRSLRFAFLPDGEDPDSLVQSGGRRAIEHLIAGAVGTVDVMWLDACGETPPADPDGRAAVAAQLKRQVATITDPLVRRHYEEAVETRLRDAFRRPWRNASGGQAPYRRNGAQPATPTPRRPRPLLLSGSERHASLLLWIVTRHPTLLDTVGEDFASLSFADPGRRAVHDACLHLAARDVPPGDAASLRAALAEAGLQDVLAARIEQPLAAAIAPVLAADPAVDEATATLFWNSHMAALRLSQTQEELRSAPGAKARALQESVAVSTQDAADAAEALDQHLEVLRSSTTHS